MQGVLINCNMRENLYMDNIMINDLQQQTGKTSSIFFAWFTSGQYSTYTIRLRQNCSSLKGDPFRCIPIDSCCNCDNYVENDEHYFLHCKLFVYQRNVKLSNIRDLGLDIYINDAFVYCMELQILHMMSTAHFSQLFTDT